MTILDYVSLFFIGVLLGLCITYIVFILISVLDGHRNWHKKTIPKEPIEKERDIK